MKKLLALVLCVMMFVAIIPTAAFADDPATSTDVVYVAPNFPKAGDSAWPSITASKKAISDAKANIEYVYGALAADTAVFGTIKGMDEVITSLAKGVFADVDGYSYVTKNAAGDKIIVTVGNSTLVDNTKAALRDIIGSSITTYMNKHIGDFATVGHNLYTDEAMTKKISGTGYVNKSGSAIYTDGESFYIVDANGNYKKYDGAETDIAKIAAAGDAWWGTVVEKVYDGEFFKYDPIKYANTFAKAVNDAWASEKGAKGLEALMYNLYLAKAADEINDKMDDLADEIAVWEGTDNLLAAYGFNDGALLWTPYAFLDDNTLPKPVHVPATVIAPDLNSIVLPDGSILP
jgi:hypothetical protein